MPARAQAVRRPYLKGAELLGLPPSQCIVSRTPARCACGCCRCARGGWHRLVSATVLTKAGATKTVQDGEILRHDTAAGPAPRQPLDFCWTSMARLLLRRHLLLGVQAAARPHGRGRGMVRGQRARQDRRAGVLEAVPEADEKQQANLVSRRTGSSAPVP